MSAEKCAVCGVAVTEGGQICKQCLKALCENQKEAQEAAEELQDIADVLKITADTDKNIKTSMEAILRIADKLERSGKK